jgi:hypothetical protein
MFDQTRLLEMAGLSTTWRPIEYREVPEPEKVDRTWLVYADRTCHNVQSLSLFHARLNMSPYVIHEQTLPLCIRSAQSQRPVTSSDLFRLCFFIESYRACSAGGRGSLLFSLPLKTLANEPTNLCITLCTCVSIFSQTFSRVMLALQSRS